MLLACQYDDAKDASWWLLMGRLSTSQGEASQGKAVRTDKEVQRRDVDGEVDEGRYTTLYKGDTEEWSAALLLDLGR